jgi:hypothetical protein
MQAPYFPDARLASALASSDRCRRGQVPAGVLAGCCGGELSRHTNPETSGIGESEGSLECQRLRSLEETRTRTNRQKPGLFWCR